MLNLKPFEADVLERVRRSKSRKQIALELGKSSSAVSDHIRRLVEKGAIKSNGSGKYVVIAEYTRAEEAKPELIYEPIEEKKKGPPTRPVNMGLTISDDEAFYIKGHYNIVPRTRIAKRLGVSKPTFNLMVLQLGIGE